MATHTKIVVIGGTSLIGSKTVAILRQGGHEVVAASRRRVTGRVRPPRLVQRLRTRPRGGGPRPGPSFAGAGGDPRAAGGHSPVVPVCLPCGGRRRRLSLRTGLLGVLTACWVRAELDDRMR
jgi:hypothetical protein